MKRVVVYIALFVGVFVQAQSSEELFSQGNKLYQEGEYSKAIDIYDEIEAKNIESADLYFNIGNCYYMITDFICIGSCRLIKFLILRNFFGIC